MPLEFEGTLVLGDFFGVATDSRLLQLALQLAQLALLLQLRGFAVVALELRQFGIKIGGGVFGLLLQVFEFFLGGVDAGVEVFEGGAVQRGDVGAGGVRCLRDVVHGDGAVAGFLVEALGGGFRALHVGDILLANTRHRLNLAQVVVGVHMAQAGHHAVDGVIDEPDRLGIELAGVVDGHHRLFLFLGGFGAFFCSSGFGLGRVFVRGGVITHCLCFGFFRFFDFAGGVGERLRRLPMLLQGATHRICRLRPALHPGAQDLHLFGGEAGECAGALHFVVQRFEIRCA